MSWKRTRTSSLTNQNECCNPCVDLQYLYNAHASLHNKLNSHEQRLGSLEDSSGCVCGEGTTNTAVGVNALSTNFNGSNNVAIGPQALYKNDAGSSNVAVGSGALIKNEEGDDNTAVGNSALFTNDTGTDNVALGNNALYTNKYGSQNVALGSGADVSSDNATNRIVIGTNATGTGDNEIALGNTSITAIKGQVATSTYADERTKKDIQDSHLGLEFINNLRPVTYKRVNPADYPDPLLEKRFTQENPAERPDDDDTVYDGLIAQEVQQTLDTLGVQWSGHSIDAQTGKQGLQYAGLVIPLINAVKELTSRLEALENNQ